MLVRDVLGHYRIHGTTGDAEVLQAAEAILRERAEREGVISSPKSASEWLRTRLAGLDHEEFHVVWLDTRHRILTAEVLFRGGIAGCEVAPRTVAQRALETNAAACLLAHNHPSGNPEPSAADRSITTRLRDVLAIIDCRVLDHVVVGTEGAVSFAERGWL